ncbi:hypothetical protein Dda_1058 [Drechslerella dactyloides]|uniref:Uncharacterized protein n=1 Tax=Drechslerella dactyloides TaxID=74499 RepID=A0AAD6J609_DREDA|nr:hypothetical protein Dda_1058 [Drechslerella dactyloides]
MGDDSDWGQSKHITKLQSPDNEDMWSWDGAIRGRVFGDVDRCLYVPSQEEYSAATIRSCPEKATDLEDGFHWLIKGKVVWGIDPQPVFEGYIRSYVAANEQKSLCLASWRLPYSSPLLQNDPSWARSQLWDIGPDEVKRYKEYESAWGPAFLQECDTASDAQTWHIGLGASQYSGDPDRWTWIRPASYDPGTCPQPDKWCLPPKWNERYTCPDNYAFRRGLARPYLPSDDSKVPRNTYIPVQVGCTPSLWTFQPNFVILNGDGTVSSAIIKDTITDARVRPYYDDPDFNPHTYGKYKTS